MGVYYNVGNHYFSEMVRDDYVDKTGLIRFLNEKIGEPDHLVCVTRPRRFGKTFAADMLAAYYDRSCDSLALFQDLKIAQDPTFRAHLNQYHVLAFAATDFISQIRSGLKLKIAGEVRELTPMDLIPLTASALRSELLEFFPEAGSESSPLDEVVRLVWEMTGIRFVVIIDEWDAVFREFQNERELQEQWLSFLRGLFRSGNGEAIALGYMTGILPIRRYGTQSALPGFKESSMLSPGPLEKTFGFTEEEVRALLPGTNLDYGAVQGWYDGYTLNGVHVYNPVSIRQAMLKGGIDNYWNQTETSEGLRVYIDMDFDGLQDDLIRLLNEESVPVDVSHFENDMTTFQDKDDVLTLLIHLGYLTCDPVSQTVSIPNRELAAEFRDTLRDSHRKELRQLILDSDELLESIWNRNGQRTAQLMEKFHNSCTVPRMYYSGECLRSTICMAMLSGVDSYIRLQELPSGKGYADILYLPLANIRKPAILVELKWNRPVNAAIQQILDRNYPQVLPNYSGEILLVEITCYANTKNRRHVCSIQKFVKP